MQVKFKSDAPHLMAAAVAGEVGTVIGEWGEDASHTYQVLFPVYGGDFPLPADQFDVIEGSEQ